jgi:hypothetical protein
VCSEILREFEGILKAADVRARAFAYAMCDDDTEAGA